MNCCRYFAVSRRRSARQEPTSSGEKTAVNSSSVYSSVETPEKLEGVEARVNAPSHREGDPSSGPPEDLLAAVCAVGFGGRVETLPGGRVNHVWRVHSGPGASPRSAVLKWAPPWVASVPQMALDDRRILFEARALAALERHPRLSGISDDHVRAPRLLATFEDRRAILMEDLGDLPDLATWLRSSGADEGAAYGYGRLLGDFIGRLHLNSMEDVALARRLDNRGVQRSRLGNQYAAVVGYAERARLPDAGDLGRRAVTFGELLQRPGTCLVMGDLWPPSILIAQRELRLIDWEFATYGRPAQDVGHLAAHLWMQAHRAPDPSSAARWRSLLQSFFHAYGEALGPQRKRLMGAADRAESAVHFGAEILTRTVGAFQAGYLYEGLAPDQPSVQEAVSVAALHLRRPGSHSVFAALQ